MKKEKWRRYLTALLVVCVLLLDIPAVRAEGMSQGIVPKETVQQKKITSLELKRNPYVTETYYGFSSFDDWSVSNTILCVTYEDKSSEEISADDDEVWKALGVSYYLEAADGTKFYCDKSSEDYYTDNQPGKYQLCFFVPGFEDVTAKLSFTVYAWDDTPLLELGDKQKVSTKEYPEKYYRVPITEAGAYQFNTKDEDICITMLNPDYGVFYVGDGEFKTNHIVEMATPGMYYLRILSTYSKPYRLTMTRYKEITSFEVAQKPANVEVAYGSGEWNLQGVKLSLTYQDNTTAEAIFGEDSWEDLNVQIEQTTTDGGQIERDEKGNIPEGEYHCILYIPGFEDLKITIPVTVKVQAQIKPVKVSFDSQGGSACEAKEVIPGEKYGELQTPVRNGYTFTGWYTSPNGGETVSSDSKVTGNGDITLYAGWKAVEYVISYQLAGGDNDSQNPSQYTIESATILLKDAVRKGYRFGGWYSDASYQTKVVSITKGSFGDMTLYAKWEAHEHTYDAGSVTKQPTCAAEGEKTYTCTVCGETRTEPVEKVAHNYDAGSVTKQPTCVAEGEKTYTCTVCGETKTEGMDKAAHAYEDKVIKATLTKDGSITPTCSVCGETKETTAIYHPEKLALSESSYCYDGKAKKPGVTVKDAEGRLIEGENYKVSYANGRKNVGEYKVTITFQGNYKGTKTLTFTIVPAPVKLKALTPGSRNLMVKWTKNTKQTSGYEIQYATDKKFSASSAKTVVIKKNSTTSKKITKLLAKKKYYVRIRTYKTVSGKKYYSAWSKVMSAKTKK